MITAEEAREKLRRMNQTNTVKQKELAEDKIVEAILKGRKYCWLGFRANEETVKWLEAHGYIVRIERITRSEKDADTRILW